mmetsp:Transcript_26042/g.46195  ORF Transcript_26042/g.46195 Transcript_26042/m.46195 type:complete len:600 (-) Transcript_26042:1461-3260(-)
MDKAQKKITGTSTTIIAIDDYMSDQLVRDRTLSFTDASASPLYRKDPGIPRAVNSFFPSRNIQTDVRDLTATIWVGAILALFGTGIAILENELCYHNDFQSSATTDVLRFMLIGISAIHWIVIYKYYSYHSSIAEAYGEIHPGSSVLAPAGYRREFCMDLLSVSFVVPPTFYMHWEYGQVGTTAVISIGDILLPFVFTRCLQIFKLVYLSSSVFRPRDSFIIKSFGIEVNFWFPLKSILRQSPFLIIFWVNLLLMGLTAIILSVYERTTPDSKFDYFWNSLWVIFTTQTTIGYGDIIPRTHLGRGFIMVICLFGTFMVSYFVSSINALYYFPAEEAQFMSFFIAKCDVETELKPIAIVTIQRWWRYMMKKKRRQFRIYELWRFRREHRNFALKFNKLKSEETDSIGVLINSLVTKEEQVLENTLLHLKGFKIIRKKQDYMQKKLEQFQMKIDRYESMLKRFAPPLKASEIILPKRPKKLRFSSPTRKPYKKSKKVAVKKPTTPDILPESHVPTTAIEVQSPPNKVFEIRAKVTPVISIKSPKITSFETTDFMLDQNAERPQFPPSPTESVHVSFSSIAGAPRSRRPSQLAVRIMGERRR